MIKDKVSEIVKQEISKATYGEMSTRALRDEATLRENVALDSLDRVEIAMEIESRLGLPDESMEALEQCKTVGEVVEAAWSLLCEGGGSE